jgi:histidinol-phosphate phosphatase family protein
MALSPAIFLDKDGTLVHDVPCNDDPARIRLRHDAGPALAWLQRQGYRLVLVSNQAGVARGVFEEPALDAVWRGIADALSPYGVVLDAIYYCPHHPQGIVSALARACDCRKPAPGMLRRAAREHGLDLARSWVIGDILDDIEAGRQAGCRTVLLDVGSETEWRMAPLRRPHLVAASLTEAAAEILDHDARAARRPELSRGLAP